MPRPEEPGELPRYRTILQYKIKLVTEEMGELQAKIEGKKAERWLCTYRLVYLPRTRFAFQPCANLVQPM